MPGKRITDHQVHKYKQHRNQLSQVASAAKAGISERSARRIEDANHLPSQRPERNWRTRPDPLEAVWDSEVVPMLQTDARLNAVTPPGLFAHVFVISDHNRQTIRHPQCRTAT